MTQLKKITLLTGFFFIGLLTCLQAQDKYKFATVTFRPHTKDLVISLEGKEFKKVEVAKEGVRHLFDTNAALDELNKLSDEGWEIFDTSTSVANVDQPIYVFFLRKKV